MSIFNLYKVNYDKNLYRNLFLFLINTLLLYIPLLVLTHIWTDGRTDWQTEKRIYPGWAGHPDGFLQVYPGWAGHPDGFLQVNTLLLYPSLSPLINTLLLYPSLSPYWQTERWTKKRIHLLCMGWRNLPTLRVGWSNLFSVVLLCQFLVLAGNSFWLYILLCTWSTIQLWRCVSFFGSGRK